MEIWDCLSQGHLRSRSQPKVLKMRVENMPPAPPLERYFELLNFSVNSTFRLFYLSLHDFCASTNDNPFLKAICYTFDTHRGVFIVKKARSLNF